MTRHNPKEPRRPALRYHGGKWKLAPWIIGHFPAHRVYVEPFGGAASVLLRKPRSYAEIYNDIDGEIVGLFRVLQNRETAAELAMKLTVTPYARAEFEIAYQHTDCAIESARRLIIRSFMGFGSTGTRADLKTGFRANSNRSGTTPAQDWANYPAELRLIVDRLRGVVLENRPAIEVMAAHDSPETLHYVDPPYVAATRKSKGAYRHEINDQDHLELIEFLRTLKGTVVLSGYDSDIYKLALEGWRTFSVSAHADGARPRREFIWINSEPRQPDFIGAAPPASPAAQTARHSKPPAKPAPRSAPARP